MRLSPVLLGLLAACSGEPGAECDLRSSEQGVLAEDRNILGAAGVYPADTSLRDRTGELNRSQKLRREIAWQSVAKLLAPVSLGKSPPNTTGEISIPLWQSFYGSDEAERIFLHLYEDLSPDMRDRRQRFDPLAIDDAFGWNVTEVEELENWPETRRNAYLDAIDSDEKLTGIAGVDQVGISQSALRHMVRSYPEVLRCGQEGVPDASIGGPGQAVQEFTREALSLPACSQAKRFGPFHLAAGERLVASLSGEDLGDARVRVWAEDSAGEFDCESLESCEVSGKRVYMVEVLPGNGDLQGALQVDYKSPNSDWSDCLESPFSNNSVIVKANWRRIFAGEALPTYKTSANSLRERLKRNESEGWGTQDGSSDPGSDSIYTMELPNGQRYRLAGLHIMTKEIDHWQWISLWWSDDPDNDFGQDRPPEIAALGGPWSHYKMCAVSMFNESDPLPGGGFEQSAPDLAAALESVYQGVGQASWCSNPYIEEGPHNMATNCIGCHQHGGTVLPSEDIIGMPSLYPESGRTQVRNNFPQDYSWVLSRGDRLGFYFKEVVEFFAP